GIAQERAEAESAVVATEDGDLQQDRRVAALLRGMMQGFCAGQRLKAGECLLQQSRVAVGIDQGSLQGSPGDEALVFLYEANENEVAGLLQHFFYRLEAQEGKGAPLLAQAGFDQCQVLGVVAQLGEPDYTHRHGLEVGVVYLAVLPLLPGGECDG